MPTFPYYSSNYPPVWSYLVSIPMAWSGPGLAPARLVSTSGWRSPTRGRAGHGRAARCRAARSPASWRPGFFLASPYVFHTTPLARVNSLALLAAVIGLTLLERPTRRRVRARQPGLAGGAVHQADSVDAVVAGIAVGSCCASRAWRCSRGALDRRPRRWPGLGALVALTHGAFWLNVVVGQRQSVRSRSS